MTLGEMLRCVKTFGSTGNTQVRERRYDFYLAYAFDETSRVDPEPQVCNSESQRRKRFKLHQSMKEQKAERVMFEVGNKHR
jgi:hypothetical protein